MKLRIFSVQGRSRRTEYLFDTLIFTLSFVLISSSTLTILKHFDSTYDDIFNTIIIFFILYIILDIISTIKRLHDLNNNGSHIFFLLIPLYNLVFFIRLYFQKGTDGFNNYGPDPRFNPGRSYNTILARNVIAITVLIVLIWSVSEIEQNRNFKEVKEFIQHPTENQYLLLESDEDADYKYYIIKITDIIYDSCDVYCSKHLYGNIYDAKNSISPYQADFNNDFSYIGTYPNEFLEELKIVELINE